MGKSEEVYFSFDKDTKKLVTKLGYIPEGCYCSTEDTFIQEHADKNRRIVMAELSSKKVNRNVL
jgi:hypothetical protein